MVLMSEHHCLSQNEMWTSETNKNDYENYHKG